MRTTDILNHMTISDYIREIMSIPLDDSPRKYNGGGKSRKGIPCPTRDLGRYRSLCAREKLLRLQIAEETAFLGKAAKCAGKETSSSLKLRKHGLVDMCVELGEIMAKKQELKDTAEKIENPFLRSVIFHRYFENTDRKLPSWSDTAKEIGVCINGDELRRYVSAALAENCSKKTP